MAMDKLRLLMIPTLAAAGFAQSFEVASVKPAAPNATFGNLFRGGPGTDDPGRLTGTNVTMMVLLTHAFGVAPDQLTLAEPAGTVRVDIQATLPAGATKEQVNVMLQNLLAERFHMTYHKISKEFPAYNLTVAKGRPKLKPTDGGPSGAPVSVQASCSGDHVITHNKDVAGVAAALGNAAGARVIDKTGLAGNYDVDLYVGIDHSNNGMMRCNGQLPDAPGPIEAVEKQLGLKLEKTSIQLDVIIIDHLDRSPSAD